MKTLAVLSWDALADCLVDGGRHPYVDGWFLLFEFPNALSASVVHGPETDGYQVGVMRGEWLVDVVTGLRAGEVLGRLVEVMERSE